jgi:hypothetical protein
MGQPSGWSEQGLPSYSSRTAPSFSWTDNQLRDHGLVPTGGCCAFVESQYVPAALYLIT